MSVEQEISDLRRRIADLEQGVGRSGLGSIGHSQLHGLEDHLGGGVGLPLKPITNRWGLPGWYAWAAVGTAVTAGNLYYTYFVVKRPITIDQSGINVNTAAAAGSLGRFGIYTCVAGRPGTLVVDAGTVSTASTGNKTATTNQILYGDYFTAAVFDNTPLISAPDPSASTCAPPNTGMATSMSNQPYQAVLYVAGQSALVAGGLPTAAVVPTTYADPTFNFVRVRWTD